MSYTPDQTIISWGDLLHAMGATGTATINGVIGGTVNGTWRPATTAELATASVPSAAAALAERADTMLATLPWSDRATVREVGLAYKSIEQRVAPGSLRAPDAQVAAYQLAVVDAYRADLAAIQAAATWEAISVLAQGDGSAVWALRPYVAI